MEVDEDALAALCPTHAIGKSPIGIDMGKCVMCGECAFAYPAIVKFTKDYKIATNVRESLVVKAGDLQPIAIIADLIRKEIQGFTGGHSNSGRYRRPRQTPTKPNSTHAAM